MRFDPGDAVMVGDSPYDIAMGHRAGMPTCAVTYGAAEPERLLAETPTHVAHAPGDLLAALAGAETA